MRTSIIRHRADEPIIMLRADYLEICDRNFTAAMLLSVFELSKVSRDEYINHGSATRNLPADLGCLWVNKTYKDLEDDLLGLAKEDTIRKAISLLKEKSFIETRTNPQYKWDRTLQYRLCIHEVEKALSDLSLQSTNRKTREESDE